MEFFAPYTPKISPHVPHTLPVIYVAENGSEWPLICSPFFFPPLFLFIKAATFFTPYFLSHNTACPINCVRFSYCTHLDTLYWKRCSNNSSVLGSSYFLQHSFIRKNLLQFRLSFIRVPLLMLTFFLWIGVKYYKNSGAEIKGVKGLGGTPGCNNLRQQEPVHFWNPLPPCDPLRTLCYWN